VAAIHVYCLTRRIPCPRTFPPPVPRSFGGWADVWFYQAHLGASIQFMSVDAGFTGELLQGGFGKEALVQLHPVSGYVRGTIYQVGCPATSRGAVLCGDDPTRKSARVGGWEEKECRRLSTDIDFVSAEIPLLVVLLSSLLLVGMLVIFSAFFLRAGRRC
jgi:hypothetical protein